MFKLKNYNSKISILIYFEDTGLCHYGHSLVSSNARRMKSASCEIFELRNSRGMKSSINVIVAERNLRGINPREKKSSRNRTATNIITCTCKDKRRVTSYLTVIFSFLQLFVKY